MEDLHDPPAEAYDDDGFVEQPLSGLRAELCSSIVDQIEKIQRSEAVLKAWQLEMIDEARLLSEATERGVLTVDTTLSVTRRQEMARRSLIAELACALRMPEASVIWMVADSEALVHRLPGTMAALRAGEITYRHAQVLVDQTTTLPADATLAVEEQALPLARTLTVSRFTVKARRVREHLDPESITIRVAKTETDRRLEFQPAPDGMAWLTLYTTAPVAASIYTAVRDRALALKNAAEPRTLTQLTADICADALSAALSGDLPASCFGSEPDSAFRRIRPTITVTVPALTLLGITNEQAILEGCGPIDPDTARFLAGQSSVWFRMLTDPKTGAPLALDPTTYRPSKAMKRFLAYRDGTCRFPGCNRAARHCDIDHTTAYAFGGPTECENLSHLCPKHHRLKHQTTWQVTQRGSGVLAWTSPGGHNYVTEPEVLLAAPDPPPAASQSRSRSQLQPPKVLPPPNQTDPPPF